MNLPAFINGILVEEYAKLEYGRLLWRVPAYRERLLNHWHDPPIRTPNALPPTKPTCATFSPARRTRMPNWTPNCASVD
jgi:hypothetical protein